MRLLTVRNSITSVLLLVISLTAYIHIRIFETGRNPTMAQMAHFSFPYYFTIPNSEFRILNSEFRILNSEFRIPKFALRISEFGIVKYIYNVGKW